MRFPALVPVTTSILLLILVSGCTPTTPEPVPEPTPSFVAPYATDEEALAAAEEAYAEYSRVVLDSYGEGSSDPSMLRTVASGAHLEELLSEFDDQVADGHYILGEHTFDQFVLQRYSRDSSPREVIAVYLCDDVSGLTFYRDGHKIELGPPPPPARMQVVFDLDPETKSLLVSARDIWSNEPCG